MSLIDEFVWFWCLCKCPKCHKKLVPCGYDILGQPYKCIHCGWGEK